MANILRGFFFRQNVGSLSKSRQHVEQEMLASNVGQNVVSICAGLKDLKDEMNYFKRWQKYSFLLLFQKKTQSNCH